MEVDRVRVAAVFPGQGSQVLGMGGALVERYPVAAERFTRASDVLGYDLLALVRNGPEAALRETRFSQPAIYVTNCALAAAVGADLTPVATAGHSFAELCSLTLAGALAFEDGVALVAERGDAMHEAALRRPGAMAAVLGLEVDAVRAAVADVARAGSVRLANFNAPNQIVISGDTEAIAAASARALELGAKRVVTLNVSGAWHSELMAPARARFARSVAAVALREPGIPVVSSVDGAPYTDVSAIRSALERSVTDEVRWHAAAELLLGYEPELIVEFGGSAVLAPMIKRMTGAPAVLWVGNDANVDVLRERLAVGTPA